MKERLAWCLCVVLVTFVQCIADTLRLSRYMAALVIPKQQASCRYIVRQGSGNRNNFFTAFSRVNGDIVEAIGVDSLTVVTESRRETC